MNKGTSLVLATFCCVIFIQAGNTDGVSSTPSSSPTTTSSPSPTSTSPTADTATSVIVIAPSNTTTTSSTTATSDPSSTASTTNSSTGQTTVPSTSTDHTATTSNTSVSSPSTTSSTVITPAPIMCLNGSCNGNASCLAGINTTCELAQNEQCYQITTTNSSSNLVNFQIGCRSGCEPLIEDATVSTGNTTRQTTCCTTSKCNNVQLQYPYNFAADSKQQFTWLVLAAVGVMAVQNLRV